MTTGIMDVIRHKGCTPIGLVVELVLEFGFGGMGGLTLQVLPKWQFGLPSSWYHE